MNSLPKTVTRQHRGCDLNSGPSATESSTLSTWLPSHPTRNVNETLCHTMTRQKKTHCALLISRHNVSTDTHLFNGLFSRTTWVSRYQKGKSCLNLNEARDDGVLGWKWHQLDRMQTICSSLQTDNPTISVKTLKASMQNVSNTKISTLKPEYMRNGISYRETVFHSMTMILISRLAAVSQIAVKSRNTETWTSHAQHG